MPSGVPATLKSMSPRWSSTPGDVGQDDVVVPLLDQAHRDAGHRLLDLHARVHQRERRAAHRGHRRGAVGLEDVGHDADRVGEVLLRRDHRQQRPLGERAVADVAALGAAHEAGLPDRERREVVVVEVALGRLEPERVQALLLAARAERRDRVRLRLAAREERGAVRARRDARPRPRSRGSRRRRGRPGRRLSTAIRRRMMSFSSLSNARCTSARRSGRPRRRLLVERRTARARPPRPPWSRPGARACPRPAWRASSSAPCEALISSSRPWSTLRRLDLHLRLAGDARPARAGRRRAS